MNVLPHFKGQLKLATPCPNLTQRLEDRVKEGFLSSGVPARANYQITTHGETRAHIVSNSIWTGINVGLNDIQLTLENDFTIAYQVTYWTWARYVIGLCAALGILLILGVLAAPLLGLNETANTGSKPLFLANIIFWSFCWPWILIALHKRPARRCLERILREVAEE